MQVGRGEHGLPAEGTPDEIFEFAPIIDSEDTAQLRVLGDGVGAHVSLGHSGGCGSKSTCARPVHSAPANPTSTTSSGQIFRQHIYCCCAAARPKAMAAWSPCFRGSSGRALNQHFPIYLMRRLRHKQHHATDMFTTYLSSPGSSLRLSVVMSNRRTSRGERDEILRLSIAHTTWPQATFRHFSPSAKFFLCTLCSQLGMLQLPPSSPNPLLPTSVNTTRSCAQPQPQAAIVAYDPHQLAPHTGTSLCLTWPGCSCSSFGA